MKPSETKKNITNIIREYSQEFGIAPQFVEKGYYVIKVLSDISKINYPDLKIIFSCRTCLSKVYNKIQRFSEDMDFRIHTECLFTRAEKQAFCNFILEKLDLKDDYYIIQETVKKEMKTTFSVLKLNMKNYMMAQIYDRT